MMGTGSEELVAEFCLDRGGTSAAGTDAAGGEGARIGAAEAVDSDFSTQLSGGTSRIRSS